MSMFRKLWNDECGAILSSELVLIATILVIGMIVGLKSVRDSVVTELADVAQAIANIDQSYSYSGTAGHAAFTDGSWFTDAPDFCDGFDQGDFNSKCVLVAVPHMDAEGVGNGTGTNNG